MTGGLGAGASLFSDDANGPLYRVSYMVTLLGDGRAAANLAGNSGYDFRGLSGRSCFDVPQRANRSVLFKNTLKRGILLQTVFCEGYRTNFRFWIIAKLH